MELPIGGLLQMVNDIYKINNEYYRVLHQDEDKAVIINCNMKAIPHFVAPSILYGLTPSTDIGFNLPAYETISSADSKIMHQRYTLITPLLSYLLNPRIRTMLIKDIAKENELSHMTIRNYYYSYLVAQDIRILLPKHKSSVRPLSEFEINIQWALNKFYYTEKQNTLVFTYQMLLKEKYTTNGILVNKYPSFPQFRYFYQRTKSPQKEMIRRQGIKKYQRNKRPLLSDGVTAFAPNIGVGMLDSTVLDIYLINDSGQVVGRPILTICVDANSQMVCGYYLGLQGGIYSVEQMLKNVITDKSEYCQRFSISISNDDWPCNEMPGKLITDMGSEFVGSVLEQITDLGVVVENLPAYRPELKGVVEKTFDILQGYFKPQFKGKGVIEPDFHERGSHDYRKDASLTIEQFEKVIIRCILFYNNSRIIENYPFTQEMLNLGIQPYAKSIWLYKQTHAGCNLINIAVDQLNKTLLPRTVGKYSRRGLLVNHMRYGNKNYINDYLDANKKVIVAYDEFNTSTVYLLEGGEYIPFELVESRFSNMSIEDVNNMKSKQKKIIRQEEENQLQAKLKLLSDIETIRNQTDNKQKSIKDIRVNRNNEILKQRRNNND